MFTRKISKSSGPVPDNVEYNNPPISMDGKFITPFTMVITCEDEEMIIETDDPSEAEYMVTLYKYPELLKQVLKQIQTWVRKENMKIVEDE